MSTHPYRMKAPTGPQAEYIAEVKARQGRHPNRRPQNWLLRELRARFYHRTGEQK